MSRFEQPSRDALREFLNQRQLALDPDQREAILESAQDLLRHFEVVQGYEDAAAPASRNIVEESVDETTNPYGAWSKKFELHSTKNGVLSGKRIAVKDNIAVAGVRMSFGAEALKDFVPNQDATVVQRVLDAGGSIAGTATCEAYCLSGGSHTSWPTPV